MRIEGNKRNVQECELLPGAELVSSSKPGAVDASTLSFGGRFDAPAMLHLTTLYQECEIWRLTLLSEKPRTSCPLDLLRQRSRFRNSPLRYLALCVVNNMCGEPRVKFARQYKVHAIPLAMCWKRHLEPSPYKTSVNPNSGHQPSALNLRLDSIRGKSRMAQSNGAETHMTIAWHCRRRRRLWRV